jgi:hypothetical protein
MLGLKINAAKGNFFDRAKVIRAVDAGTRRVLSRFGAFVRTRARTSMRRRRRPSEPGQPPSVHTGLIKRFIFFVYELARKSVVIGPVKLNSVVDPGALAALEYGGQSTVEDRRGGPRRRITVRPRPYMRPALKAELSGLSALWKNSIR